MIHVLVDKNSSIYLSYPACFRIRRLRSWRQTVLIITQNMFIKPLPVVSRAPLDQDMQVIEDTPDAVHVESCTHWVISQHNLLSA